MEKGIEAWGMFSLNDIIQRRGRFVKLPPREDGMGEIHDFDAVMATVRAVRDENARLCAEADELRGALKESRRMCRRLRMESAEAQRRAARDVAWWRHLLIASVALAVAATCLMHSLILAAI